MPTPQATRLTRAERWFDADAGRFHCLDWGGTGPLLHLAHATGYCAGTYSPLAERLTTHARVIGLDDRGHGSTTVPADPRALDGWDAFADDQAGVFRQLGEPVIAVGHSRGGTVGVMIAARHPGLVRALVLIDPTILPLWSTPFWFVGRRTGLASYAPIAYRAARRRYTWPDRETIFTTYRSRPPFSRWRQEFLRAYVEAGTGPAAGGGVAWRCHPRWEARCFTTCPYDIWRDVARVRCPTLVIYGLESNTFLGAAARRFARTCQSAKLMGLAGTSHFVPMERPEETVAAIAAFVSGLGC